LGGVRAEDDKGDGSLILISPVNLPTVVLAFFGGGGGAAVLRLPALVLVDPAPGLADESSSDSPLGVQDVIRMARIIISPSYLGIMEAIVRASLKTYAPDKPSHKRGFHWEVMEAAVRASLKTYAPDKPSHTRGFHWEVMEAAVRTSLKTYAPDNLVVFNDGSVFQNEIILK
jgi:hypothetical protein